MSAELWIPIKVAKPELPNRAVEIRARRKDGSIAEVKGFYKRGVWKTIKEIEIPSERIEAWRYTSIDGSPWIKGGKNNEMSE